MVTQSPGLSRAVFHAVADPTRRAILDGLGARERTAGDIAADFADAMSRPAVCKHLRILGEAGLVEARKHGRERRYRLRPEPLSGIDEWLTRYRLMWSRRLVDLKELAEQAARDETTGGAPAPPDHTGDPR